MVAINAWLAEQPRQVLSGRLTQWLWEERAQKRTVFEVFRATHHQLCLHWHAQELQDCFDN